MVTDPGRESEFAAEIDGRPGESTFGRIYAGDPPSRLIAGTAHFVVLADLAPLTAGHLLVVPRDYRPSFAALPDDAWRDWRALRRSLAATVAERYSPPVFFEHGSTAEMAGGACITHAHLHVVPGPLDMAAAARSDGLELEPVNDQRGISMAPRPRPYFYFEDASGSATFAWADDPVQESQYVRRIAAGILALPDPAWDWGVEVRRDLLRETMTRLGGDVARA